MSERKLEMNFKRSKKKLKIIIIIIIIIIYNQKVYFIDFNA